MQNHKVGNIIRILRQEKELTQKELADTLHISDKTVSKWERGLGCPDISLLAALAEIFSIDIQKLLSGDMAPNDKVGGNMRNSTYYICPTCQNISFCTGNAEVSCCGKRLLAQKPRKASSEEQLSVELVEDDWYITSQHPMTKLSYISFAAFVTGDRLHFIKQYPEWNFSIRIPHRGHGQFIWYSTEQGLLYQLL